MSELFDDDPRATPPPRASGGRSRALLITAVTLILAIFALTGFASIYTDRLWYQSAGYGQVFSTMLWTKVVLFLLFGTLLGGAVALNIYLAYRFRPLFRPTSREQSSLDRYRDVVTPIRTWLVVGIALVLGAFAGASGLSHWRTYQLWRNGSSVGSQDAYFNKDIGFYLFDLPWWHFVVDFTMATMVLAIIAALVTHYLYGGIRLQATQDRLSGSAQAQLSVLLGIFVLAKGVDYYLDRFDLVTQKNRLFTGMNYTGENAVLPAKNILMAVAVICAVLFFLNVWRRTWQLPSVGLALLALSAILIGMIFPAVVQQFQVKPSEADKEAPYIQKNIDATRQAYDIADVEPTPYSPNTDLQKVVQANLLSATSTTPVMDPKLVSPAFEALQQQFGYYSVPPVLDVDRYTVDGKDRAMVLGVRELDQAGLSDDARNWSNLHTVYTHGAGIIAAYANQRDRTDAFSADTTTDSSAATSGRIEWAQGRGSEDDLTQALGLDTYESRIYYGERSPDYSVVGKADAGADDVELNLPVPGSDLGEATTYGGEGDASVGSTFNQLMFAIKFGEPNFLLSGRVNDSSKVLYVRDPRERVEKVAPWLNVDTDAYPALVDGKILWIVDGYTTTDRYPNAQRESFDAMIKDALQTNTGLQTVPTDEINYMRNAVKATVDAYTGEVTLYAWDETDPILKAWREVFPGSVKDQDEMSEQLLDHVRYPEDLFKVQRYQYARYHVQSANDWYENNDRWAVPVDPQATSTFQAPYRLFVGDTATGAADSSTDVPSTSGAASNFALTSVYVPFNRDNLASFVSVDSDGTSPDYGRFSVLELSNADSDNQNDQTSGPGQVANEFVNDTDINAALQPLKVSGAKITYGNMLTLPVEDGLMYVQPVYAQNQSSNASYPELRYVLVKYGDEIGYGTNLQLAIKNLYGGSPTVTNPPDGTNNPPATGQTLQELLDASLDTAITAFTRAETLKSEGDFAGYLVQVDLARKALDRVAGYRQQIENGADPDKAPTQEPSGQPSAGSTDQPTGAATTEPTASASQTPATTPAS
ncbi:UPF0182 family protein [Nocardioides rubriscoriae]|uniref:UPF0182 family protein n=1 Tax=Nocardioides rubriscoriae TaxID=642762 RepID=UPI0011E00B0C|nr:UPF0182 family protein [Nocardioides rubriscoriae]